MNKHKLNRFSVGFTGTTAAEYQSWVSKLINNDRAALTRGDLLQAVVGLSSILDPAGAFTETYIPFAAADGSLTEDVRLRYNIGNNSLVIPRIDFENAGGGTYIRRDVSGGTDAAPVAFSDGQLVHEEVTYTLADNVLTYPDFNITGGYKHHLIKRPDGWFSQSFIWSIKPTVGTVNWSSTEDAMTLTWVAFRLNKYGAGTKDAITLTKTQSNYLSGYATDGTLLEVTIGGSFADDTAAATGSVLVGQVYYNTTSNRLATRMT